MLPRLVAGLLVTTLLTFPAFAADWTAVKVRGTALALTEGKWVPIKRGDIISDDRSIRTESNSRLELQHGNDIVSLESDTQISIQDLEQNAQTKTVVRQSFGTVEVEAEVKDTEHLTVETKYLAAVVKGTHFIVTTNERGAAVEVTRGLVAVKSTETEYSTDVAPGNTAYVKPEGTLWVAGTAPIPKLLDRNGVEVPMPSLSQSEGVQHAPLTAEPIEIAQTEASAAEAAPMAEAAPAGGGGLDIASTGIGIAIGIMLGAVGLMLRRVLR